LYLVSLCSQLVYLLYNSMLWMIISFKTNWKINFSSKFQILLWHTIYSNNTPNENPKDKRSFVKMNQRDFEINQSQIRMLMLRRQNELLNKPQHYTKKRVTTINDAFQDARKAGIQVYVRDETRCTPIDNRSDCSTTHTLMTPLHLSNMDEQRLSKLYSTVNPNGKARKAGSDAQLPAERPRSVSIDGPIRYQQVASDSPTRLVNAYKIEKKPRDSESPINEFHLRSANLMDNFTENERESWNDYGVSTYLPQYTITQNNKQQRTTKCSYTHH